MAKSLCCICNNVHLRLVICGHRVRRHQEASARTPVVLDVDGWMYQLDVKKTDVFTQIHLAGRPTKRIVCEIAPPLPAQADKLRVYSSTRNNRKELDYNFPISHTVPA